MRTWSQRCDIIGKQEPHGVSWNLGQKRKNRKHWEDVLGGKKKEGITELEMSRTLREHAVEKGNSSSKRTRSCEHGVGYRIKGFRAVLSECKVNCETKGMARNA